MSERLAVVIADTIVLVRTGPGWFAVTGWGFFLLVFVVMVMADWGVHIKFKDRGK